MTLYSLNKKRTLNKIEPFSQKVVYKARLEQLLDVLQKTHKEKFLSSYLSILLDRDYNKNHASIATLAINGFLPNCITLNFDLLIENAISKQNGTSCIFTPLTNGKFDIGDKYSCIKLFKLHRSLVPSNINSDQFKYLSTTLSDVGEIPDKRNKKVINKLFSQFPVLIVGGYSDNDWDIFPIIVSESNILKKILWIQYNKGEEDIRVRHLLENFHSDAILLYGRCDIFFSDILKKLNLKIPIIKLVNRTTQQPDTSFLSINHSLEDLPTIRTLVSFAMLQPTGANTMFLFKWLKGLSGIKKEQYLLAIIEDLIGHEYHTIGKMRKAIRYTKRVLYYKKGLKETTYREIADTHIWLGYEYLCLAKRPLFPFLHWPLLIPYYWSKANFYFAKGLKYVNKKIDKRSFMEIIEYYKIDLLHGWGNLLTFFLGHNFISIQKKYYSYVYNRYESHSKQYDLLKDRYYWLRKLEAFLFSGGKVENVSEIKRQISEIEKSYNILQNFPQLGNTDAYRALLNFTHAINEKRGNKEYSIKLLMKAAKIWSKSQETNDSAQRRIIVFRRYFGDIDLFNGLLYFFRLKDIFKDKWWQRK